MEEKILRLMEKNSRISVKDLAVMLGISEIDAANTIADLEKKNVICGYNTIIDWDKTSEEKVTALIEVKVTPQRGLGFDSIAERLYQYEEVTSVYLMSGGFDFTVIVEGKSMKAVAQFVSINWHHWNQYLVLLHILSLRNIRIMEQCWVLLRKMKGC